MFLIIFLTSLFTHLCLWFLLLGHLPPCCDKSVCKSTIPSGNMSTSHHWPLSVPSHVGHLLVPCGFSWSFFTPTPGTPLFPHPFPPSWTWKKGRRRHPIRCWQLLATSAAAPPVPVGALILPATFLVSEGVVHLLMPACLERSAQVMLPALESVGMNSVFFQSLFIL
jgi:hypothetical protein